ncbi:hypothetical protein BV898_18224 [Hypsibius exemplaris]|uniref:Uncharacterized protein n=1 Tax=Hypsibius exemplaris TaxID=2072580 RepID=A0A9X6NNP2_HYPEX|nr:hypothetical protein BV898_18224 [Hypsibius exemplaris]
MAISVVFFIVVLFVLLIAPPAFLQAVNDSGTDSNFSGLFGNLIIDQIKAGKALKASVEDVQKISYQQDSACNDCGNPVANRTAPQPAPTSTSTLQLVNSGTSGVIVRCAQVGDIIPGPQFILPSPQSDYYLSISVVNASSASAAESANYLSYNSVTGFVKVGLFGPAIDVTQEYSAVLINRKTLETSNPVFFTALIRTCVMNISGPKSFAVCIGIGTPYLGAYTGLSYTTNNSGLLVSGVKWDINNPAGVAVGPPYPCPGASGVGAPGPFVTAFSGPGDANQCYIYDQQSGDSESFARGNQYSPCVYDRCVTPASGAFNSTFYTATQLAAFTTQYGAIPDPCCSLPTPLAACTTGAKTYAYCGTCLALPASVAAAVGSCTTADTFTQTLTVTGHAPAFTTGVLSGITATFDSTCNSLSVFNVTY